MRLKIAALLVMAPTLLACTTRDDDYQLLRRTNGVAQPARLQLAAASDAEAYYVRHLLANGFGGELLRTYAMAKRFAAHTTGYTETPTRIALGASDASEQHVPDRSVKVGWWRTTIAGDAPVIWIDDSPARRDRSTMADLVSGLGEAIVDVVAPETARRYRRRGAARGLRRLPEGRRGGMAAAARHRRSRRPAPVARVRRRADPTTPSCARRDSRAR